MKKTNKLHLYNFVDYFQAKILDFERAAEIRDRLKKLREMAK